MSFGRVPFQFTTTDPVERQRELEKRFGLHPNRNMFVDVADPLSSGKLPRDSSISPRLQHRVPIFMEGQNQPIHSSVDSTVTTSEKKPNVRVIPIEIEGAESRPSSIRHRTFSGPAGVHNEPTCVPHRSDTLSSLKRSMADLSKPTVAKATAEPRVHTIPIKVEGERVPKSPKKDMSKINGVTNSKSKVKSPDKEHKKNVETVKSQIAEPEKPKDPVKISLKKIEDVLEEFKSYEAGVKEFNGTSKDKQYRYLDEMLTRCMLKLDDIDTMGNENLRSARKSTVRKVQAAIDLLESKANPVSASENEIKTTENKEGDGSPNSELQNTDAEMAEDQGAVSNVSKVQDLPEIDKSKESTSVPMNETENLPVELSNEVSEIEMTEIKEASSQELNSAIKDILEVEMADISNDNAADIPSSNDETVIETEINRPLTLDSQDDVEMKEIQCTLDDIKENVAAGSSTDCIPSQHEASCVTDVSVEANVQGDLKESSIPNQLEDNCEPEMNMEPIAANALEMDLPSQDTLCNSEDTENSVTDKHKDLMCDKVADKSQDIECNSDQKVM